ncbi:MAG: shikimate dehydrogenase [Myxococcota bacterium]
MGDAVSGERSFSPGAETVLCGVVLHPAGHTRSPAMHNAAFRALGLDAVYLAFDVPPAELGRALAGARALGVRQLAISLPHKVAVMEHLDEVDATARAIGAVNTVTREGDHLVGSNTDWLGAVRALEREAGLAGARAVVLGAGGSARAVVWGLRERGAAVTVLNRSVDKARALAGGLGAEGAGPLSALADTPHDVLVNTTSVGLRSDASPVAGEAIAPGATVLDAVYDPPDTRLLQDARGRGARTVAGKWMLVYQAAAQLERWTGKDAPVDVMADAFDA